MIVNSNPYIPPNYNGLPVEDSPVDANIREVSKKYLSPSRFGTIEAGIWVMRDLSGAGTGLIKEGALITGHDAPKGLHIVDLPVLGAITAMTRLVNNSVELKECVEGNDPLGIANSTLLIVVAISQLTSMALTLPADIARCFIDLSKTAVATIGPIVQGTLGTLVSAFFLAFMSVALYHSVSSALSFKGKSELDQLKQIRDQMTLSQQEKKKIAHSILNSEEYIDCIDNGIKAVEISPTVDHILDKRIQADPTGFVAKYRAEIASHIQTRINQAETKSQKKLAHGFGQEAMSHLSADKLTLLIDRLENHDSSALTDATSLLKKVKKGVYIQLGVRVMAVMASLLGLIATIGGFFLTGGLGLGLVLGISILGSLCWMINDGYLAIMSLRHDEPGKYERLLLMIVGVSLSIMLTTAILLSPGLIAMMAVAALSLVLVTIYAIAAISNMVKTHKQRKAQQDLPSDQEPLIQENIA